MYTEVYIDAVFLVNFLMDYILLRLIGRSFSIQKKRIRYLYAAGLGALFACGKYWVLHRIEGLIAVVLHILCAALMLRISCGMKNWRLLSRGVSAFYFLSFLLGGIMEAAVQRGISEKITIVLFPAIFYVVLNLLWDRINDAFIQRKHLYEITLKYREKNCETCGFYDTGNLLTDPVTGKPVSVIGVHALTTLIGEQQIQCLKYITANPGELENTDLLRLKPHLLPFHSVGRKDGMLVAITLDELCIHTPKGKVRIANPVLALHYDTSALDGEYEVLLNSRLL